VGFLSLLLQLDSQGGHLVDPDLSVVPIRVRVRVRTSLIRTLYRSRAALSCCFRSCTPCTSSSLQLQHMERRFTSVEQISPGVGVGVSSARYSAVGLGSTHKEGLPRFSSFFRRCRLFWSLSQSSCPQSESGQSVSHTSPPLLVIALYGHPLIGQSHECPPPKRGQNGAHLGPWTHILFNAPAGP